MVRCRPHFAGLDRLLLVSGLIGGLIWASSAAAQSAGPAEPTARPNGDPRVVALDTAARPLVAAGDLDPIIERAADRRLVLLGESSHGTSEFYRWRATLTRRLVADAGYRFIAVEGDWVPIYRLNRYVKGLSEADDDARAIMESFDRWPTWMWANEEMLELVEWLRAFNAARPAAERVGLYGIDVYGDDDARRKVEQRLAVLDPELGRQVAERYRCLTRHGDDLIAYARAVSRGQEACDTAVAEALELIVAQRARIEPDDPAAFFHLEQSARAVKGAERHFRKMAAGGPASWNARVDHFFATVERLGDYFDPESQGIVWAHNTHIGDARATAMAAQGQRNIGQLARERHGREAIYAVGFGTYAGTVMAARAWGEPGARMETPPAASGSFEDLAHRTGRTAALWLFDERALARALTEPLEHRAIGVLFRPERERTQNYVTTRMTERYDAFVYLGMTEALRPLP